MEASRRESFLSNSRYLLGESFVARRISGENVLVPVGDDGFNGMITFNETGNFLLKKLIDGCPAEELAAALMEEYEVTEEQASGDVGRFLKFCLQNGILKLRDDEENSK